MIGRSAIVLGAISVLLVNVTLWLREAQVDAGFWGVVLLLATALAVLMSSVLLAITFRRHARPALATMFALNVVIFIVVQAFVQTGVLRGAGALWAHVSLLVGWLNLYLIVLVGLWRLVWAPSVARQGPPTS
jgi:hypothetical protein